MLSNMERLKQTIAKLENDVAELKEFKTKIRGSTQSNGTIHYCAASQEFGEYDLDELDTFRFLVSVDSVDNGVTCSYRYTLQNPTPELSAYLSLQGKRFTNETSIPADPDHFEEYCMKKGKTPFVLTDEIRKCLDSKLWEFAIQTSHPNYGNYRHWYKDIGIPTEFYIDIPITFEHTYKISPHVSFYITPLSNPLAPLTCTIHEITTKQVIFRIRYGYPNNQDSIYSGFKLHYSISGIRTDPDNFYVEIPILSTCNT